MGLEEKMRLYRELGLCFTLLSFLCQSAISSEESVGRGTLASQHFECISPHLDAVAEFPAEGKLFRHVESRVYELRDTIVTSRITGNANPYLKHAKKFDRDVSKKLRYAGLKGITKGTHALRTARNCYVALGVAANTTELEERVREANQMMEKEWRWGFKSTAMLAFGDVLGALTRFKAKKGVSQQDYLDRGMDINRLSAPSAIAHCISESLNPEFHYYALINEGLSKLDKSMERPLVEEFVQRNVELLPLVLEALITRPLDRDLKVGAGNPIFENRAWLYANQKKAIPELNESINIATQLLYVMYAEFGREYDSSLKSFSDANTFQSISCINDAIFDTKNGFHRPFYRREYDGLKTFLREQRVRRFETNNG
jgi:hypothetical protein